MELARILIYYFNIITRQMQDFLKFLNKEIAVLYEILTFALKDDKIYGGIIFKIFWKVCCMRKYFPKLLGNSDVKNRLCGAILSDTLPHAFLVVGAFGSGKKTLAKELAAALNCENRFNENFSLPCHECNTCRRIRENLFADLHFIKRDSKKMSLGVDEIHKMREDMILTSSESDYRIYVIEEAEKLTPQAQNAMLTVLEEPPSKVIIMLLANEADKILTTVKSRAQSIAMQRFSEDELTKFLRERSDKARIMELSDKEKLSGVLIAADGRIGQALALIDDTKASQEITERRELVLEIINKLGQNTAFSELYLATRELPTGRVEFKETLEELLSALRDLILIKYDAKAPLIFFTSHTMAKDISAKLNTKRLFSIYDIIKTTLEDNAKNANIGAAIANLAAEIKLI